MKRLLIIALAFVLFTSAGLAKIYHIPHVAGSSAWTTMLVLDNTSGTHSAEAIIVLYDADGSTVATLTAALAAGETREYRLRDYGAVTGKVDCAADFVSARLGFMASEATGGGTAEFNLPHELTDAAALNLPGYYDGLTWSGYALFNASDETITVRTRYFTTDGLAHTGIMFSLDAHCKRVAYFADDLGQPFTNLSSVVFETDTKCLAAIIISGHENEKLLFTNSSTYADSWENVDRYSCPDSILRFVGQAVTNNHVIYALSRSSLQACYPARNLVKCYAKYSGELVWETEFDDDLELKDIKASPNGSYVYVVGNHDDVYASQFGIRCLSTSTGAIVGTRNFYDSEDFTFDNRFKRKILVSALGNTVLVVYQTPSELHRVLLSPQLNTELDESTWTMDTLISDLTTYDGEYYLFRSDFNVTHEVYNVLSIYHFPYDDLSGGGIVKYLQDLRYSGERAHALAVGPIIVENRIRFIIKLAAGVPVYNALTHIYLTPADVIRAYIDLSDSTLGHGEMMYSFGMPMSAHFHSFIGPEGNLYSCGTAAYRSMILQLDGYSVEHYSFEIKHPVVQGDTLYVTQSGYTTLGLDPWSNRANVVKTRRTSFTDFFLNWDDN